MADAPVSMPWGEWLKQYALPAGVQFGLGTLGNRMASGPSREQNAWERQKYEEEQRRRNLMQSYAAPSMFKALGYQPDQIPGMTQQVRGSQLGGSSTGNAGMVPQTQGSTASKALGGVGTGLALGSMVPGGAGAIGAGLGALGIGAGAIPFIGPALLGAGLAANKIGQGRRTANTATGEGGFERNFTDALTRISSGQGSLEDLQAARQQYEQGANAYIGAGGNQRKVGQQSLNNQDLQETYRRLLAQLQGGAA